MERYEQFMLKTEKGLPFKVLEGKNGKEVIRESDITTPNVYSTNYTDPPIPDGYHHVCGEWNNGFVIERDFDKSQFVWIPVGSLDANGTLDGVSFTEKFGRRNYQSDKFSGHHFHEPLTKELSLQTRSVIKYGGFYISRYNISWSIKGEPQSVRGVYPWVNINFETAQEVASKIENTDTVKSHLVFGSEYDSVLEWFLKSSARPLCEIISNSTKWGNHWNTWHSPRMVVTTGFRDEWCTNNIYDLAGNIDEWTQESYKSSSRVIRGGYYTSTGFDYPVAYRGWDDTCCNYNYTGFRAALYIK